MRSTRQNWIPSLLLDGLGPWRGRDENNTPRKECRAEPTWIVLDLVDVVVHVFQKDVRTHYDLERLWGDVPAIEAVGL